MKIHPVGGLFHCGRTDGRMERQTNMTKLIVAARNFANVPNEQAHMIRRTSRLTRRHTFILSTHQVVKPLKDLAVTFYVLLPC